MNSKIILSFLLLFLFQCASAEKAVLPEWNATAYNRYILKCDVEYRENHQKEPVLDAVIRWFKKYDLFQNRR